MSSGEARMRRLTLHRWVDAAAAVLLLALATSGFLLRWTTPPGRGILKVIHFRVAQGFLGVMGIHLLLHWRWISANLLRSRDERP